MDFLVLWVLIWVLKNAAMDVAHAVKGTPNPRYALKLAKAKAAGQPAPTQPRYGTREWAADLWADGLQAHTERRRRRAADARRDTPVDQLVDAVGVRSGEDWLEPALVAEPSGPETSVTHSGGTGFYRHQCYTCGHVGDMHATRAQAEADADRHRCPKPAATVTPADPQPATTEPTPGTPTGTNIIPFPNRPKEDTAMSTTTTEVYGLDQSINYARQLEEFAGTHGPAGNEGYLGHLQASQVSGAALSTATQMQQAFEAARAAAEAHRLELEKQTTVQEAYATNPDAGDKAYMTQGR